MDTTDSVNQLAHSQNTHCISALRILAQNMTGWQITQDRRKDLGLQHYEKKNELPLHSKLYKL